MTNLEFIETEGTVNHYEGYDMYDTSLQVSHDTVTGRLTVGTFEREWSYTDVDINDFDKALTTGEVNFFENNQ